MVQAKALFQVDASEVDGGVPNVLENMGFFSWAGVGLPQEEACALFLAMTKLKAEKGLELVRFFGKILTTGQPYYVLYGTGCAPVPSSAGADGVPPEVGSGLNQACYFVSNSVVEPFEQLPDVSPAQVVAAQGIKKYFTGSLDAPVTCFPPFPGAEREYLRAQVARISAATWLVPSGKLAFDEEVEEEPKPIIASPDYAPSEPTAMLDAESWSHMLGGILAIGRCTNPPKPEPEEGEEPEEVEEEEEKPALLPVGGDNAADKPFVLDEAYGEQPAWTFKLYHTQGKAYSVAIATSHRWPGAYSAAVNKADKVANVYLGYGLESTGVPFTPMAPPTIMVEGPEPEEPPDVELSEENKLLKEIDEAKIVASNEEPAEEES